MAQGEVDIVAHARYDMCQILIDMRGISSSWSGLAVGCYIEGLGNGDVDIWNVSEEA